MSTTTEALANKQLVQNRRPFLVSLAETPQEVDECLRLRYEVFAGEMHARIETDTPGMDRDGFDEHCKHLMVRDSTTGEVVATTRVLNSDGARRVGYFYSETEFDMQRVLDLPGRFMEIGRTCVHRDYRRGAALAMLWHGLARLTVLDNIDYLIGCASIPLSEGDSYVRSVLDKLRREAYAPEHLRVTPLIPLPKGDAVAIDDVAMPPLLKGYLRVGASICGEPYWDAAFNVADVFILVETSRLTKRYARHFVNRV